MEDDAVAQTKTKWHHIRIKPTETALDPERVEAGFERLHRLEATIEFSLVSNGEHVDYYAGTDSTEIDRLERILRDRFPDDYEFTRDEVELDAVLGWSEDSARPTDVTTVEFTGRGERRKDWQTRLSPVTGDERDTLGSLPLVPAVGTMAGATTPVVYQALLDPKLDWRPEAEVRLERLKRNEDTLSLQLFGFLTADYDAIDEERELDPSHQRRVDAIEAKDCRRSFTVHARAAAVGEDAHKALTEFEPAFEAASGDFYHIDPRFQTGETALEVLNRLENALPRSHRSQNDSRSDSLSRVTVVERSSLTRRRSRILRSSPVPV